MKFICYFFFIMLLSCNQASQSSSEKNTEPSQGVKGDISGCYESIYGKDTTTLKLEFHNGDSVKGTLRIHYVEKDQSSGEYTGKVIDDKIIGWYNFASEGKFSIRQIVFKTSGDTLVEGFGDIKMLHDSVLFKNIETLNYLDQRPLIKRPCQ